MTVDTAEIIGSEIHVTLEAKHFYTRWPCAVCEGHTGKDETLAVFVDAEGQRHVVCDACLKAGADAVPDLLEEKARSLEAWARELRECAMARWFLPTYEEWAWANGRETHRGADF